jgi:hypothetical protein
MVSCIDEAGVKAREGEALLLRTHTGEGGAVGVTDIWVRGHPILCTNRVSSQTVKRTS